MIDKDHKMKHECPVCEGEPVHFQKDGKKLKRVICWACSGTGEVDYEVGIDFCDQHVKKVLEYTESRRTV